MTYMQKRRYHTPGEFARIVADSCVVTMEDVVQREKAIAKEAGTDENEEDEKSCDEDVDEVDADAKEQQGDEEYVPSDEGGNSSRRRKKKRRKN